MTSTAEPVLSVKERLALIQSGSNTNPLLGGAAKPVITSKPKPAPGPNVPKPAGGPGPATSLKPVTPTSATKPFAVSLKPTSVSGNAPKPETPEKPTESETQQPLFPKLRPVQRADSEETDPVKNKPAAGLTALRPKKPELKTTPVSSDDAESTPRAGRPLSIAARMAALNALNSQSTENGTGPKSPPLKSPGFKSPVSPKIPTETGIKKLAHLPDTSDKDHFAAPKSDIRNDGVTTNNVTQRPKPPSKPGGKRWSSELFLRHSDGKKFRKVLLPDEKIATPAPTKPSQLGNVELTGFVLEYAKAKEQVLKEDSTANGDAEEGEMDEQYVEAESTSVPIRGKKGSLHRTTSVRVSKIPEMTEEEEFYDDCQSVVPATESAIPATATEEPQEFYDDCASGVPEAKVEEPEEDPGEIYEAFPEENEEKPTPPPLPSPSPGRKEKEKDKEKEKEKEKNKDGKKKGKDDAKKEEKERKKKEEERKMRHKFGLKDTDEKVGEGVVQRDEAGSTLFGKDLGVTRGEIVTILRMEGNPTGKWLVQNSAGKLGYVSAGNIEVSTPTIRNMMTGVKVEHAPQTTIADDGPDEIYEEVPAEEGEMEEVYEEC